MSFIPGANVGPYRIVEQAERNGLATTYTAYQPAQGRYVSVVVIPSIPRDDVPLLRQRQRQLELITSLRHPNILTVLDHGEHMGVGFIVTELVEAEPLSARLGAPWPLSEVVRVLRPVASALDYAHGQDVAHGDVRPTMVLVTPDGTPILSGFGLTVRLSSPAEEAPTLALGQRTRPPSLEISGGQQRDRRGLALIAYEMLTGRAVEVDSVAVDRPLPPTQLGSPLLTPTVERTLLRELAGEPTDRYPSASVFVEALSEPLAPRPSPIAAGVLSPPGEPEGHGARRRWTTLGMVVAIVAVLGVAVLLTRNAGVAPSISDIRATATANGSSPSDAGGSGTGPSAGVSAAGPATSGSPGARTTAAGSTAAGSGANGTGVAGARPGVGSPGAAAGTAVPGAGAGGAGAASSGNAGAGPSGAASAGNGGPGAGPSRPGGIALVVPSPGAALPQPTAPLPIAGATGANPGASAGAAPGAAAGPSTTPGSGATAPASTPGPSAPGAVAPTPRPVSTRIPATWRVEGDESGKWSFDPAGQLLGHVDDGASLMLFPETKDDVDYSATVNTSNCQSTLVFHAEDSENLMMAIYIPDGLPTSGTQSGGVWLYQRVEGLDLPIRAVRPSTVRPAGEPVKLRVATSGAQILVSLNDEPAIQAVDTIVHSGKLGTMVYAPDGKTCEATFGDIQR